MRAAAVPALALALAALLAGTAVADVCRQGPEASTLHCALPGELGNFQGYYRCADAVKIGKPRDKQELAQLVGHFSRVKGVGVGHSWWGDQFCAGNSSDAINIVTTELNATLALIKDPVYYNASSPPPAWWPIQVHEDKKTVTAAAGVPQRLLLDSLAAFTSDKAPSGYAIPAPPLYIDQTIGGAVSTGTHGSSFLHKSLSSQLVRLEIALANGTIANFTEEASGSLWHAVQIGVGRLGVITEVELQIMPQDLLERESYSTSFDDFVAAMQQLQADYLAALNSSDPATAVADVLSEWEGTQLFWFVPMNSTTWVTYRGLEAQAEEQLPAELATQEPAVLSTSSIGAAAGPAMGQQPASVGALSPAAYDESVDAQVPSPALGPVLLPADNPVAWNAIQYSFLGGWLQNMTAPRRDTILAETAFINKATSDTDPYDQWELSVSLENAGDCLGTIGDLMRTTDARLGFPVPPFIRFVGAEEALLSNTHGGPRVFFNIEDHLSYSTGVPNTRFNKVVSILRDQCGARMHWGKAGWTTFAACFDGSKEYPETWCDFGCAVQELDPNGKFASMSDVWTWRATKAGQDVPFGQCCDGGSFSAACTCAASADCKPQPGSLDSMTPHNM